MNEQIKKQSILLFILSLLNERYDLNIFYDINVIVGDRCDKCIKNGERIYYCSDAYLFVYRGTFFGILGGASI